MAEKWDFSDTISRLEGAPEAIAFAFQKADAVVNLPNHERIMCSVSGGSDSDVMMDLLWRVDRSHKIHYAFFNTGIEYRATLDHLDALEEKYGVEIERVDPIKSIPVCVKQYGSPVISKFVSEQIERLQKAGFQWDDLPYEELRQKYPGCPTSPLKWWSNEYKKAEGITGTEGRTMFNIDRNKYLRDFILEHPPDFPVSNACCSYAKKKPSNKYVKDHDIQLLCTGVRKSEGGIRAVSYKNCYSLNSKIGIDHLRPIFWFTDEDKDEYCRRFEIVHSRCYTMYGLKRTGCTGCPYNRNIFDEMGMVGAYEPQMIRAANSIFQKAYEWTMEYRQYADIRSKGYYQYRLI